MVKQVKEILSDIKHNLNGTIDDVIEYLHKLKDECPKGQLEAIWDPFDGDGGLYHINLYFMRDENDDDRNKQRMELLKIHEQFLSKDEKAQLDKLKKKYEVNEDS